MSMLEIYTNWYSEHYPGIPIHMAIRLAELTVQADEVELIINI